MTQTLNIDITVNQVAQNLNATYAKNSSSTATDATVDEAGNIRLVDVGDTVDITWTLANPPSGIKFRAGTAFTYSPKNPGNPGQEDGHGFTETSSTSNDRLSVKVLDTNAVSNQVTPFNYQLWLNGNRELDPSIINR